MCLWVPWCFGRVARRGRPRGHARTGHAVARARGPSIAEGSRGAGRGGARGGAGRGGARAAAALARGAAAQPRRGSATRRGCRGRLAAPSAGRSRAGARQARLRPDQLARGRPAARLDAAARRAQCASQLVWIAAALRRPAAVTGRASAVPRSRYAPSHVCRAALCRRRRPPCPRPTRRATSRAGARRHPRRALRRDRRLPRLPAARRLARGAPPRTRRPASAASAYHARPVPGFGDPGARILLLGLAPAKDGGNRTGRVFTGDRSGDFLFAALHRVGLANQPTSISRDDGLELHGAYVAAAVRCAPPDNKPLPEERDRCAPYLHRELALLAELRVIVALGAFAWRAALQAVEATSGALPAPAPALRPRRRGARPAGTPSSAPTTRASRTRSPAA